MLQNSHFILATGSERRIELFRKLNLPVEAIPADFDEIEEGIDPEELVTINALGKARSVFLEKRESINSNPGILVVGCDTVVSIDGKVLGKPEDKNDAVMMLKLLSGRAHYVYSGLCIKGLKFESVSAEMTVVHFRKLDDQIIEQYLEKTVVTDYAGGYAIQELGSLLVKRIEGSFYNVVGFPLELFISQLLTNNIEILSLIES